MKLVGSNLKGNKLYRGPRPRNMNEFYGLKCNTVINLQYGWFEWFHNKARELDGWASLRGVSVLHIPCSDFTAPTQEQIRQFLLAVKNAMNCGNVYVCCLHGVDRTGIMVASYRVRVQGWSVDEALDDMLDEGFHTIPYFYWAGAVTK